MKDGFFKKELVIGIIVLFVGAGIVPTFGRTIGNLNNEEVERTGTINGEIWVNGSNTEGPWDGTEEHPYRYIQEGVDNADPYDTMIYVADCTYYECLTVDVAGIKLEGESRENTIIDGSEDYSVVRILGDDIELVNFTITNSGELNYGLRIGASDVKIHKCDIVGNYFGVEITGQTVENVKLELCSISNNGHIGVIISDRTKNNDIHDCTFIDNNWGMWIVTSGNNEIKNCDFINNTAGIELQDPKTSSNTISYCDFEKNDWGLFFLSNSYRNKVTNNDFKYNSKRHIYFHLCTQQSFIGNYFYPKEGLVNNLISLIPGATLYYILGTRNPIGNTDYGTFSWNTDQDASNDEND